MAAFRTIYKALGTWNDHWGRVKTGAGILVVLGAGLVILGGVLVRRYGWLGAISISVGGLILLCLLSSALINYRAQRRERVEAPFPKITVSASKSSGFLNSFESVPDKREARVIGTNNSTDGMVLFHGVRVANRDDHPVSLSFELLVVDGTLAGNRLRSLEVAPGTTSLLADPLNLEPGTATTGQLAFEWNGYLYESIEGDDKKQSLRLVVEEHTSRQEVMVPLDKDYSS